MVNLVDDLLSENASKIIPDFFSATRSSTCETWGEFTIRVSHYAWNYETLQPEWILYWKDTEK